MIINISDEKKPASERVNIEYGGDGGIRTLDRATNPILP
jgi:type IV secretory pathway VirJ component